MAAGLPVAAPDVGDIRQMVAEENRGFIAVPDSAQALAAMLAELVADPDLRTRIGAANRVRAIALYDAARMVAQYRAAYGEALGHAF